MSPHVPKWAFEAVFSDFVMEFGGEVLSPIPGSHTADYLFLAHNVIAELKCLQDEQTTEMNSRVEQLVKEWISTHKQLPSGWRREGSEVIMAFVDAPEEIRKGWAKILSDPVENIIKKAHRQIRDTKKSKNFPSARGVVLIFNEGNLLHNRPQDFARIAGEVIQKPNSNQSRRFPHIDGMVYFSGESVTTVDEVTGKSMPFWGPFQVAGDGVEEVKRFQNKLKEGWFQYVARKTGRTVVSHRRDMKWP